jgi:2C-methyl-D-erythritol 2,4-cyclodiphosphate synthase
MLLSMKNPTTHMLACRKNHVVYAKTEEKIIFYGSAEGISCLSHDATEEKILSLYCCNEIGILFCAPS